MSRMTKYLKQRALVQHISRDSNGDPILDDYGDSIPESTAKYYKCRRVRSTKDVLAQGGAVITNTTTYYFDNSLKLEIGDLVDGKPILTIQDYVNERGISEGYEVST